MAPSRSSLASYTLADAHVPLTPTHAAEVPPAVQEPALDIPSLSRRAKTLLINYPCRLRSDQVDALNRIKAGNGATPAELIRDAVDLLLRHIEEKR